MSAEADVAALRLGTPHEQRPDTFESFFHADSLAFPEDESKEILRLLDAVPTLACVTLERPAVLPEIAERAEGRLPFELPRSMAAVEASRPDVPGPAGS